MSAVIRNALAKYFLYYIGVAGTQGLYGLISTDPAETPPLLILSYVAAVAGIALIIRFDYRMSKQYPEEGRLFWLADLFYIAALPCTLMFSLPFGLENLLYQVIGIIGGYLIVRRHVG